MKIVSIIAKIADRDNIKIPIHIPVLLVKVVLPRVVLVLNLLNVLQQQIEHVQNVDLVSIKMWILIRVLRVNHALLHAVLVPNIYAQQRSNELAQYVNLVSIKI